MCGRYSLIKVDETKLKRRFAIKSITANLKSHYNIPPSSDVPIIRNDMRDQISLARWGLLPSWARDENSSYKMINARSETIAEKPSFRSPFKSKRCLILADGFYEWKKEENKKLPYRITNKDEEPFAFAGIWEKWEKGGKTIVSCSIITTSANSKMKPVHERMPIILSKSNESLWLDDITQKDALELLKQPSTQDISMYPISNLLNSPKNNNEKVIEPLAT